jgi:uncharacterized RDD family membrane protein YckC
MSQAIPIADGPDPTASVMRRIIAWVVDELLLFAVVAFAIWVTPVTFVDHAPAPGVTYYVPEGSNAAILVFVLLPVIFWFGDFVWLQGVRGYTLGKFVLSLRTVRFDGRPAGMWRAFVRSFVLSLGIGIAGCFYMLFALLMVVLTRGHRRLGDYLAGTFVIDAYFEGHLISTTTGRATAGPRSLYASEVSEAVTKPGGDRSAVEAKLRPNDPVYDKERDTYVVWNERQERLLAFDKAAKTWKPVE